jgi:iduronate 2-sulfatase
MKIFRTLGATGVAWNIILTGLPCFGEVAGERPNVLFIVVDDLRPAIGAYGDTLAKTPSIDALTATGIRFDRAYCQQSVCNPSRASFMTGKRPDALAVWDNQTHFRARYPDIKTLPQYLKAQGYHTQGIGKIFHDPDWAQDPLSWSEPARLVVTTAEGKYASRQNLIPLRHHGPAVERGGDPGKAYVDIQVRDEALRFLQTDRDQPFFLAVGFRRPHLPFSAPAEFWGRYRREQFYPLAHSEQTAGTAPWALLEFEEYRSYEGIPAKGSMSPELIAEMRHGYYAAVSYVDSLIGDLLDALAAKGLRKNTLILLLTDHGYHIGERGHWGKTTNFELDTRVPLIIAPPGFNHAETREQLVELVDLYPTIADLCGLKIPDAIDGRSLRAVLEDSSAPHKGYALSQFPRPWNPRSNPAIEVMGYSLRTRDYRYIEWRDFTTNAVRFTELYRYAGDLWEGRNLANDPGEEPLMQQSQQLLAQLLHDSANKVPGGGDRPAPAHGQTSQPER